MQRLDNICNKQHVPYFDFLRAPPSTRRLVISPIADAGFIPRVKHARPHLVRPGPYNQVPRRYFWSVAKDRIFVPRLPTASMKPLPQVLDKQRFKPHKINYKYPSLNRSVAVSKPGLWPTRSKGLIVKNQPADFAASHSELEEMIQFSQKFKICRTRLGLSQAQVGRLLGTLCGVSMSQTTISRFEALNLTYNNMVKIRKRIEVWMEHVGKMSSHSVKDKEAQEILVQKNTGLNTRRRKKRTTIDGHTRKLLENLFCENPQPGTEEFDALANKINLDKDTLRVWFCNRRQRDKKMNCLTVQQTEKAKVMPKNFNSWQSNRFYATVKRSRENDAHRTTHAGLANQGILSSNTFSISIADKAKLETKSACEKNAHDNTSKLLSQSIEDILASACNYSASQNKSIQAANLEHTFEADIFDGVAQIAEASDCLHLNLSTPKVFQVATPRSNVNNDVSPMVILLSPDFGTMINDDDNTGKTKDTIQAPREVDSVIQKSGIYNSVTKEHFQDVTQPVLVQEKLNMDVTSNIVQQQLNNNEQDMFFIQTQNMMKTSIYKLWCKENSFNRSVEDKASEIIVPKTHAVEPKSFPIQINESCFLQMDSGILPMPTRFGIHTSSGSSLPESRLSLNDKFKVATSRLNFDVSPMTQFDDIDKKVTYQMDDGKPSSSLNDINFPSVFDNFKFPSNVDYKTNVDESTIIVKSEWEKMKKDEGNDYSVDFDLEYNADFSLFVNDSGHSNFDSLGSKGNSSLNSNFPWQITSELALMKERALAAKEFNQCDFAASNESHFLSPTSRLLSLASSSE